MTWWARWRETRPWARWRETSSWARWPASAWLAAVGVLAATVSALALNVLVARFYVRWDVTPRRLYSLSSPTLETLRGLDVPVDVVVFLSRSDPLAASVRHLLDEYAARAPQLHARYVDPDRNPAEFMAAQSRYGIEAGKADDGRIVTDAALVVARGEKHWFVTHDELVQFDPDSGMAQPRLEQALTEAIRNVLDREKPTVCFSSGHGELVVGDSGPTGLAPLCWRLEKNNYEVATVDLAVPQLDRRLDTCEVLAIVGPEVPLQERSRERVERYLAQGGNLLVAANPLFDEEYRPVDSGLGPIVGRAGIRLGDDTVVELDPRARAAVGIGERFYPHPAAHAVTAGVYADGHQLFPLLVSMTRSLTIDSGPAAALLTTSDQAVAVRDIRPFLEGKRVTPAKRDASGPFVIAAAAKLAHAGAQGGTRDSRLVVLGTTSLLWGQGFRDPNLMGNRLFAESAFSWLAAQPPLVTVPEKPATELELALTERSLREVWRYVILYMPSTALLMGLLVLYRRRARERSSRRRGGASGPTAEGSK